MSEQVPQPSSRLFFGASTGRTGTMLVVNLLNSERGVLCLHEGKLRCLEEAGKQVIPYLTLQNVAGYHNPASAEEILRKNRSDLLDLIEQRDLRLMGDIAYNYAPFVSVIPRLWPEAKLLVIFRDGREFVRSALTSEDPDPTPVGWLARRPSTRIERFVELGRLRPAPGTPLAAEWDHLSPVAKNAWLWSETNRVILEGIESWNSDNVMCTKFEDLTANLSDRYAVLRRFLGIRDPMQQKTQQLLRRRINSRAVKSLPPWPAWRRADRDDFARFARAMMTRLGYEIEGN